MPIADPLRDRRYRLGTLIQQCAACHWAQRGHQAEFPECPRCGVPLTAPLGLAFGGTTLVFHGNHFDLFDTDGRAVRMFEADLGDALAFLCRHAPDHRGHALGPPRPDQVQRVAWEDEFVGHVRRWPPRR